MIWASWSSIVALRVSSTIRKRFSGSKRKGDRKFGQEKIRSRKSKNK